MGNWAYSEEVMFFWQQRTKQIGTSPIFSAKKKEMPIRLTGTVYRRLGATNPFTYLSLPPTVSVLERPKFFRKMRFKCQMAMALRHFYCNG